MSTSTKWNPERAGELARQARESRRCKSCHGDGYGGYGDTSCGRGGAGGQTITVAECHRCKGQGWIAAPDAHEVATQLDAAIEVSQRLDQERRENGSIISRVNDAIGRAGIHCALFFWDAIDQLAADRDSLRQQLAALQAEKDGLRGQRDSLQVMFDHAKQDHSAYQSELAKMRPVYELVRRWCNRPESVLSEGAQVLRNDADMWRRLRDAYGVSVERVTCSTTCLKACCYPTSPTPTPHEAGTK